MRDDITQVNLLARMYSMVETQMRAPGVSKDDFDEIFQRRKEFILNHIPTRILWLYFKYFRMVNLIRLQGSLFSQISAQGLRFMGSLPLEFSGPEDGLVRGECRSIPQNFRV